MQKHTVTGDWLPADSTQNRLEVAPTADKGLIAIRDNYDPDRVVFATSRQLANLATAYEKGMFKSIVGK